MPEHVESHPPGSPSGPGSPPGSAAGPVSAATDHGAPPSRRSPYTTGMLGAAGVATTYALVRLVAATSGVLVIIGLALFLAIGLEPAVQRLTRWRLPRWAAVTMIAVALVLTVGGFFAAAIPPLLAQATTFLHQASHYLRELRDHNSTLGRLDTQFHLRHRLQQVGGSISGGAIFGGLIGAGQIVLDATASTVTVLVLTIYLLADLPRVRRLFYRLFPASRRSRAMVFGDEIFAKIGGYVLGNVITSLIAAAGTFVWLVVWSVPYPLLLSIMVALFDLVPVVGSPTAGVIVSLVALTVSLPVAIATALFYAGYKILEDYLLVPRIIGRTVDVPATVTLVALLIGGTALGVVGALVAVPVAAAARLLLVELLLPWLDRR